MDRQYSISATTLCDIILQKLTGIINKVELVAASDEDKRLGQRLTEILENQQSVSEQLEKMKAIS